MTARPPECTAIAIPEVPAPGSPWEHAVERIAIAGTRAHSVRGLGVAMVAAVAVTTFGLPWLSIGLLGTGLAHWVIATARAAHRLAGDERALGPLARPLAPDVDPALIASVDLRASYHGILWRHEAIRRQLVEAERVQACFREILTRCSAMAQLAGRLARLANPLETYLRAHSAASAVDELAGAAEHARAIGDPIAADTLRREAMVRGRTLGTVLELEAIRDRVRARLGVVSAALDAVAASVVKLQVLDLADVELIANATADETATLADELASLEATIEDGAKAVDLEHQGP